MAGLVISIVNSVVSKIGGLLVEPAISVISKILVEPAIREGRYLFCGAKITKKFEYAKEELMKTQNKVEKRVEELPKDEIADRADVKWLDDVKNLITEVEKLEKEINAKDSCFGGCCLCDLNKKMADITETMIKLNYHSSRNFMKFKSTELAMDQLLEALGDGSTYVIGLYGMGGSGKTTLANEVGKEAEKSKLFDRVVLTTVSQIPDVERIQKEIVGLLDLKFENNDIKAVRAREISRELQSKKRILVILDDVWGKLNLEEIGVPIDEKHKNFKVLLTTRRFEVCTLMGCQKKIPLELLSDDEAWTLFKKRADLDDEHVKLLKGKAQKVAKECKGLLIAIDAVATSLKEKPIESWEVALYKLENSKPIDMEEGVRDAFKCLKLSYDFLRSEDARLLFLMCSMFPEDHNIFVEELFRYGIGLGVYREVNSFEIKRSEVKKDINYLINSCLLMRSENMQNYVKMHDVVRDVALCISSKNDRPIIVDHPKGLYSVLETSSAQDCFVITSWYEKIAQFPEQLDAPKLEILLLNSNDQLNLSYASFEGIKGLKVMGIIQNRYELVMLTLPQSIQWLTNLCVLKFVWRELGDISFVLSLKALEILDLKNSKFKGLPCGLEKLNKLKLLDLTFCESDENCYEVLRRCSQLEELYVDPNYFKFSSNIMDSKAFYLENVTFPKLQRYKLRVGHFHRSFEVFSSSKRALYIAKLNISTSGAIIRNLIQQATEVFLEGLRGCESVIPEMVEAVGGMSELIELCLVSCSKIKCLFSTTSSKAKSFEEDTGLSNLVRLTLLAMNNLIELCRDPSLHCIFQKLENVDISNCSQLQSLFPGECNLFNLKYLSIEKCPRLTRLFSMSTAQTLWLLQELSVEKCNGLKHIMTNGDDGNNKGHEILAVSENSHLEFSQLKKVFIKDCDKLEDIFPIIVVQSLVQLEEMRIINSPVLKYVFGKHDDEYCSSYQKEIQIVLPQLKQIQLTRLEALVKIVPESYNLSGLSLMEISCESCPKLTSAPWSITKMGSGTNETCGSQLSNDVSKLQILTLKNLPQLALTWMGSAHFFSFQYLEELKVINCRELKSIISVTIQTSLPLLRKLFISKCEELEEIIAENEDPQNLSDAQVCFPKLEGLWVRGCHKLKSIFSTTMAIVLPQLESLWISDCAQIEEIFRCEHIEDSSINNRKEFMLLNLTNVILSKLPKLVDICRGFTLHAGELSVVAIVECPKFTPILGASSVQQSQEALMDGHVSQEIYAIQVQFPPNEEQGLIMVSNLDVLYLGRLPDLVFIWKGPTLISFQLLEKLRVYGCRKLRSIFSAAVIRSLPSLEELYIKNCEELEEIISVGEGEEPHLPNPSNSRSQQPCFPELDNLKVEGCNKLKCVFPISISGDLPCLREFKIKKCSQLEQVFGCAPENRDAEMMELELQKLQWLTLEELPSLTNICRGIEYQLQLKALRICRVNDCPNFHSTTIPALHKFMIDSTMSSDDLDDEEEEYDEDKEIEEAFDEEEDEEKEIEEEYDEEEDDDKEEENEDDIDDNVGVEVSHRLDA